MKNKRSFGPQNFGKWISLVLLLALGAACAPKPAPVPTSTPQATRPTILKELYICMAEEPDDLFLYGRAQLTAVAIRHAIYENLYTTLDYDYQAQGLEKLPNLSDGDAVVNQVTVQSGDSVVNADGQVTTLAAGTTLLNAEGEAFVFSGEPVELPQMVVDFTLKPMVWSDGTAVTAADSVFSFAAAAYHDEASDRINRTASYVAVDSHTVRWTGLPGWLDQTYFLNVWTPLPQHQLANREMAGLADLFGPNPETPILSSGPFVMKHWIPGDNILLQANPHYYRQSEQLPRLRQIKVKIGPFSVSQVLSGQCDILTRDLTHIAHFPFMQEAEAAKLMTPHYQMDSVFEHIAFGINSYGGYGDGNGRPDWFEDVRVRQAIAHCTDRQRMVDGILFGLSEVMHTYVPSTHPLYPEDIPQWAYDVAAANALLDEAGYRDIDGDGLRQDPITGVPFQVTLDAPDSWEREPIAPIFQENMRECGIAVTLNLIPPAELFADGPQGKLFGRQYDLVEHAWRGEIEPLCAHWLSQNISGPVEEGWGGWDGLNNTGWRNAAFDAACRQAQRAFRNSPEYVTAHQEAMRLFAEQMPIIPLFPRVKVVAAQPYVHNIQLNPTQPSELWNVHELDITLTEVQITRATIPPAVFCAEVTQIPQIECEALVTLYQQFGSDDWRLYGNWLSTPTPCSWAYVVCARNHIAELEIYSGGSGILPSELGNLVYLRSLNLSWRNLSNLPPEIGNLTNLRHLNLTGNNLTSLPPELYNLLNLFTLDLSGNNLNNFLPEIANLVNLETLSLGSNSLSSLPPEIFSLTSLTELDLQYNDISNLPSEIGNLTNLVKLNLYWNELSDLPPELWGLTHLTELDLSGNNLSFISPEIGNLTNLDTLWLSYNNLTSLPPEIWNLINLNFLHLSSNQLSTLPAEIGNLTNIYWLNLDDNNLSKLPPEIGNLTRLNDLDLDKNNLRNLPPEIGNLTNLTFLYLRQNNLNSLPPEIGNLVNLYSLDLSGNNLSSVPPEVTNMTYLHSLDLRDNPLVTLPPEICAAFPETLRVEPRSLCNP